MKRLIEILVTASVLAYVIRELFGGAMRHLDRYILAALMVLGLGILVMIAAPAFAGEAHVSWTAPTEREDDTPIDGDLTYRVSWGQQSRQYTETAETAATEYQVTGLSPGSWYFAVQAIDSAGLESAYSNEGTKQIAGSPPLPPVLTVQESARAAYGLVQSTDRFALVPVGMVPAGTECDPRQQVRDLNGVHGYVVPRDAVQWAGSVRPRVVVAECG